MADECRSCQSVLQPSHRFCATCGTPAAADVFVFDPAPVNTDDAVLSTKATASSAGKRFAAVIGVLAILGLGWLAISGGGADDQASGSDDDDSAGEVEVTPTPERATPTSTPTSTPTPTPTPESGEVTRAPTSVPFEADELPLDDPFEVVPPLETLGLGQDLIVVVGADGFVLADPVTGVTHKVTWPEGTQVEEAFVHPQGVIVGGRVEGERDRVALYPFDGGPSELLLSDAGISSFGFAFANTLLLADEVVPWEFWFFGDDLESPVFTEIPRGGFTMLDHRPILAVAGSVFAQDDDGEWRSFASGEPYAATGQGVLVRKCGDGLECSTAVYDSNLDEVALLPWSLPPSFQLGLGTVSPDLQWVAANNADEGLRLKRLDAAGDEFTALPTTFSLETPELPVWSADGSWLLAISGEDVYAVFPETQEVTNLPLPAGEALSIGFAPAGSF